MSVPFQHYSASPEQSQSSSHSQSQTQSTRAATTSTGKKGRKSRVASVAASPAVQASDIQTGPPGVQWALPVAADGELGGSGSRAGTPSSLKQQQTNDEQTAFAIIAEAPNGMRSSAVPGPLGDDDVELDEELLPDMADDDYSAQQSWQSQSKDNLKVLMDNFTPEQYDRYEAYRRNALPKQAVRRVIQQSLGQQVSTPVAQVVAGVAKVFVGEMVEKARKVQARRGETGPLSPDHLREAYREYQEETGRVGAARPLRGKKLFVR